MAETVTFNLDEAFQLALDALTASGTSEENAESLIAGILGAELDGISSHGFMYLPIYCEHVKCGKIDGKASPSVREISPSAFLADAKSGFAHPAIHAGFMEIIPAAKENGVCVLSVTNSYNCGVLGFHVSNLAEAGLLGLGFTNAPASIAPVGGSKPVIGTNPMACGVPDGEGGVKLIIDQSSSVIARSEVTKHKNAGEPIPEGWALDPDGNPTTDPVVALTGSMVPMGGYKGVGQGLIVELLAAALSGATLGIHASSFATNDGGPCNTGQFFLALNPDSFAGEAFFERLSALSEAIESQEGARLPGARRLAARKVIPDQGITIPAALHQRILGYCA